MARIAVVDDDDDIRDIVTTYLLMFDHVVQTAKNREEFLFLLIAFKPEIVLLDVMLGGDNGRNICKEIRAIEQRSIPVILYSANPSMLANYKECKADDILDKPFELRVLIGKVNKLLSTRLIT